MEDFPSNSHKAKTPYKAAAEPKKVEKVVEGDVIRRKKPLGKRVVETFFGASLKEVVSHLWWEIAVPSGKDTFIDLVTQGAERAVHGESSGRSRRGRNPYSFKGYTSYDRMHNSTPPWKQEPRQLSKTSRASHNFDEIILATRPEAEEVIGRLIDLVERYEIATVADFYEMVGATAQYTDDKWGWSDLRSAGVERIREGYLLNLPRPEPIN